MIWERGIGMNKGSRIFQGKTVLGAAGLALALSVSFQSLAGTALAGDTAPDAAKLAKGKEVFNSAGCAMCHTLAAAGASGAVGPALDHNAKVTEAYVSTMVHNGGGAMPPFKGSLSEDDIAAVSAFVAASTAK